MKMIKVKTSDANNQKIVRPLGEARQSLLSATSQLAVFLGRTRMISDVDAIDEIQEYIKDLENTLQSFNKNLSKAKADLRDLKKWK